MTTIFLRLLEAEDKAAALLAVMHDPELDCGMQRFEVDPSSFGNVPRSPFAYWVSERLRRLFKELPPFEAEGRAARQGGINGDDFRWLRLWTEVSETEDRDQFVCIAKGGIFSRFYADLPLCAHWDRARNTFRAFTGLPHRPSLQPASYDFYFRPGLTWPRRTQSGLSLRVMPAGCIFADKGPAVFMAGVDSQELLSLLALTNSAGFRFLVDLQMAFGSFEVGVIQRTPVPPLTAADQATLAALARRAWSLKRSIDSRNETSHVFAVPALLQTQGTTLAERTSAWSNRVRRIEAELARIQDEIDTLCFDRYGIHQEDRRLMIEGFGSAGEGAINDATDANNEIEQVEDAVDAASLGAELVLWAVGVAFGRFDVRLATGTRALPPEPEPFDPLPTCSPGMLASDLVLPLALAPASYPLALPGAGLLVDDPGHALELTAALRSVFDSVFGDAADARWHEAATLLDPRERNIRPWLARGFFEHHLSRYSKSRRQAPIYWPLSSSKSGYTIWLYYHRIRRDTLFQALNDLAKPKLQHERFKLNSLLGEAGPQPTRSQREAVEAQEFFVSELEGFVEELARVAPLWNPDLNDGVIINYAPLWRMIGHTPWRKSVKQCWDTLCAGDYDWSHLAMHLWPERVVPKCATDRSLAIAHGLEEVFWVEGTDAKWKPRSTPARPVEDLVRERSSSAVKAALKSLLDAPSPGGGAKRGRRGKAHA